MYLVPISVQVLGLLANVAMDGRVIDSCGGTSDAVATVITAHGFHVSTNDLNSRCVLILCAIGQSVDIGRPEQSTALKIYVRVCTPRRFALEEKVHVELPEADRRSMIEHI